ncbi:MAG: carboxypeptidase-like regulatory domain-containing protein [Bacteroidetes bacterium]|nr:carboxypeptidase-like regulatory domain-containing protein [Bacteroidota bacterium]
MVDSTTSAPIAYATIGMQGQSIGTISNQIGQFQLNLRSDDIDNTINISSLGYNLLKIDVKYILESKFDTIFLVSRTYQLPDVNVDGNQKDGREILALAVKNIKNNVSRTPFKLTGFYREYVKENRKYVRALEVAATIYDKGYSKPRMGFFLKEEVEILQIRTSENHVQAPRSMVDINNFAFLLKQHSLKYSSSASYIRRMEKHIISLDSTLYLDHDIVYIIGVNSKDDAGQEIIGKVFIKARNYAIVRIDYSVRWGAVRFKLPNTKSPYFGMGPIKTSLYFKEINGLQYMNYMRMENRSFVYESKTGKPTYTIDIISEFMVNNTQPKSQEPIAKQNRMEEFSDIYEQEFKYNEEFWRNYNDLPRTPKDVKAMEEVKSH